MPGDVEASELETHVGVLMAGGSSRRMGEPKATVQLGGRPLAHWAAAVVAAVAKVRIQVGGAPIPELGWTVLSDLRPGLGPAGGIETALACFPGADVVICAIDTPFVAPRLLQRARTLLGEGYEAAVPRVQGRWHPLVAAYSPAILPALGDWLDSSRFGLQQFLDTRKVAPIETAEISELGDPGILLMNINAPDDLLRAEQFLSGAEFL